MKTLKIFGKGKYSISFIIKWSTDLARVVWRVDSRRQAAMVIREFRSARQWVREHCYKDCWGDVSVPCVVKLGNLPRYSMAWLAKRPVVILRRAPRIGRIRRIPAAGVRRPCSANCLLS